MPRHDRKAKLRARIDRLRTRLSKRLEEDQQRSKQAVAAVQANVQGLQKKAEHEQGDAKAAIETRIASPRADYQRQQHA